MSMYTNHTYSFYYAFLVTLTSKVGCLRPAPCPAAAWRNWPSVTRRGSI